MKGRPSKVTVDYFPHYTTHGKTIFTLESLYGNDGYAFWFKLLEVLGASENHTFRYEKQSDWLFLVAKSGVSEEKAQSILQTLADLDAIDRDLFQEKTIWCENFISNLLPVYSKRSTEIPVKPIFRGEKSPSSGISGEKIPQSKVKESKGEKSKKEKAAYGVFENVFLSDVEVKKLKDKFNGGFDKKIEALSEYMKSRGKKYSDHYATILAWDRRDGEKGRPLNMSQDLGIRKPIL
jgi:hypothetical protein